MRASDLANMPAHEALAEFRAHALSPVELMAAVISRAEEVDGKVNALCHRFFERAMDQARDAETRYMGRGGPPRPLEGIPTVIKEEEAIAGEPWTQGSLMYRDLLAGESSCFAQRVLDSGAIVHARSTAPEFSCAIFTHSKIWGVTRNPWNLEFSPGGSSGGSAAALAAGTTTLATGSDIAGSIRVPASFSGVVGFKPPYGRVPQAPPYNLDTYCHCGPMARTVRDCLLFENVLAGPHGDDVVSLRPRVAIAEDLEDARGLRIALSLDLGDWPVDEDVRRNTSAAADRLREAGAVVDEVDLHIPQADVMRAMAIHFQLGFAADVARSIAGHEDEVCAYVADLPRWAAERSARGGYLDEVEIAGRLYPRLSSVLDRYDALICPSSGTVGLRAGDDFVGHSPEVGGRRLDYFLEGVLTPVFNLFSRCPVLNVPSGLAGNGVPTGIQIAGRTYDDATPFRIGAALEAAAPFPRPSI